MANEFRVTIRLGNDAMQSGSDIAAALVKLAAGICEEYDPMGPTHAASIMDDNGNRVGQWKVHESDD